MVHPLVIIGTREEDGTHNFSPKHMVLPLGWHNHFGLIGSPRHRTFHNIVREEAFTVSYPRPTQVIATSLAASPRLEDGSKPILQALPTIPASTIDGVFLEDAYWYLECRLDRIVDVMTEEKLIIGKIVAALVNSDVHRSVNKDDNDLVHNFPLLTYLAPGRFATVSESQAFPFPVDFQR